jgi:hypothetical protein
MKNQFEIDIVILLVKPTRHPPYPKFRMLALSKVTRKWVLEVPDKTFPFVF